MNLCKTDTPAVRLTTNLPRFSAS